MNRMGILVAVLMILLFTSCGEDIIVPSRLEINSQADLEPYCEAIAELESYTGTILIDQGNGDLDLSCFSKMQTIDGTLLLDIDDYTPFRNLEVVRGGEGLAVSPRAGVAVKFPSLREVDLFSVFSFGERFDSLCLPNVEVIQRLQIGSLVSVDHFEGLHKVKDIFEVSIDVDTMLTMDVFSQLDRCVLLDVKLPTEASLSDRSFESLDVAFFRLNFVHGNEEWTFEEQFPELDSCAMLAASVSSIDELCYLKNAVTDGAVTVASRLGGVFVDNDDVLAHCQ